MQSLRTHPINYLLRFLLQQLRNLLNIMATQNPGDGFYARDVVFLVDEADANMAQELVFLVRLVITI